MTDNNELLDKIRDICHVHLEHGLRGLNTSQSDVQDLVENMIVLDENISNGGSLPRDWENRGGFFDLDRFRAY
jgi:hypothetical protein